MNLKRLNYSIKNIEIILSDFTEFAKASRYNHLPNNCQEMRLKYKIHLLAKKLQYTYTFWNLDSHSDKKFPLVNSKIKCLNFGRPLLLDNPLHVRMCPLFLNLFHPSCGRIL